jgi:hypothetical protein
MQKKEMFQYKWSDSKVFEFITVKVLRISLLNVTVVTFKVLPYGKLCANAST